MPDEFLTVAEVAALLKMNAQSIRNWIDRGELPAVRVGARRIRIRRSDLDAFLGAGETAREEAAPEPDPVERNDQPRMELATALSEASARREAGDDTKLAKALRSVSDAATRLAQTLERSGPA